MTRGAMTQYGEIMPGSSDSESDIGWIVPMCRLTKELGMKLVWGTDEVALVGQDGKEIIRSLHF
eukprot:1587068-Prorocentrum_lima.AAC.1